MSPDPRPLRLWLGVFLLQVLLASAAIGSWYEGTLRTRLESRWPACRGVLEQAYAGDGYGFLHRAIIESGEMRIAALMEKDRGEEWVDLVAAAVSIEPGWGAFRGVHAGWLLARFGTGLVMAHPASWGGGGVEAAGKPPAIRSDVRAATSAGACDGRPLTGVALELGSGGTSFTLLQSISWIDPCEGGCHRTATELDRKGSVRESLTLLRSDLGAFGLTAVLGRTMSEADTTWLRLGGDFRLEHDAGSRGITGEMMIATTLEPEGDQARAAIMLAPFIQTGALRSSMALFSNPAGVPGNRRSPPFGGPGEMGLSVGARLRPGSGLTLSAVIEAVEDGKEESSGSATGSLTGRTRVSWRIRSGLETFLSLRSSWRQSDRNDLYGSSGLDWQAERDLRLSLRLHAAFSRGLDDEAGPSETGCAMETRVTLLLLPWLELRASAASFSTDGYDSRVYLYRAGFPGQYGSSPAQGRGLLMQSLASLRFGGGGVLRLRLSWLSREDAECLGSGYEETAGSSRTEAGAQLDWRF